jgi:hypothetical protein
MMRRYRAALAGRVAPLDDDHDALASGAMSYYSPPPRSGQLWGISMSNTRLKCGANSSTAMLQTGRPPMPGYGRQSQYVAAPESRLSAFMPRDLI